MCVRYSREMAGDGKLDTSWVADCVPPPGQWTGCSQGDAYFGIDFGLEPELIRCFKIYQSMEYQKNMDRSTYTSKVKMQRWDGKEWLDHNTYSNLVRTRRSSAW